LLNWSLDSPLITPELVAHAQQIAFELLAQTKVQRLLHGDFQHHNLLQRASGDWAIIDPKGVYGNPAFDIAAWMYNPPGVTARDDFLALSIRRIDICSETWAIDRQELAAWAFVGSVLSLCWSLGDPVPADWLIHFELGVHQLRTLV
jgi:streptomycin 6-kinase